MNSSAIGKIGNSNLANGQLKPWYKHFWPWFLMSGPALVVVAACISGWIAFRNQDPVLDVNYYQHGNETLMASGNAKMLGLQAHMAFQNGKVFIRMTSTNTNSQLPEQIMFSLSHMTRANVDQFVTLKLDGNQYVGELRSPKSDRWLVSVGDQAGTWHIQGAVGFPVEGYRLQGTGRYLINMFQMEVLYVRRTGNFVSK
jgi:hypothetical protein